MQGGNGQARASQLAVVQFQVGILSPLVFDVPAMSFLKVRDAGLAARKAWLESEICWSEWATSASFRFPEFDVAAHAPRRWLIFHLFNKAGLLAAPPGFSFLAAAYFFCFGFLTV